MGCINSKHGASAALTPPRMAPRLSSSDYDNGPASFTSSLRKNSGFWEFEKNEEERREGQSRELKKLRKKVSNERPGKLTYGNRFVEAEQAAAGWPTWLSSAAPEAIHGWLPLRAESYEKMEKVREVSSYCFSIVLCKVEMTCVRFSCYLLG